MTEDQSMLMHLSRSIVAVTAHSSSSSCTAYFSFLFDCVFRVAQFCMYVCIELIDS